MCQVAHPGDPSAYRLRNVTLSRAPGPPPGHPSVGSDPAPWGRVCRWRAPPEPRSLWPREVWACEGLPRPSHAGHLRTAVRMPAHRPGHPTLPPDARRQGGDPGSPASCSGTEDTQTGFTETKVQIGVCAFSDPGGQVVPKPGTSPRWRPHGTGVGFTTTAAPGPSYSVGSGRPRGTGGAAQL